MVYKVPEYMNNLTNVGLGVVMKIKTKLTLNVVMVIIIVAGVSITSLVGMGFVNARLGYLTQKSTPFQMRTMELQRSIQKSTTDLIRLSSARDNTAFAALKTRAEQSLAEAEKCQENLAALSSGSTENSVAELKPVFIDLTEITNSRIKANVEANKANQAITRKLSEVSAQLKNLDRQIKDLQGKSSSQFKRSMGEMTGQTSTVRNIEQLMLVLKDLQMGFLELNKSQRKKVVMITQGKCNSAIAKAHQNDTIKNSQMLNDILKKVEVKINEYVKAHNLVLGQTGADTAVRDSLAAEVNENINALLLNVEQESIAASEQFNKETTKQGLSFANSNVATSVMAENSELLAQGLTVEGLAVRLFLANSIADVNEIEKQLQGVYARISSVSTSLGKTLGNLNARREIAILRSASGSLASARDLLFAKDGIIAKEKHLLEMNEKANAAVEKLNTIVQKQAEKGNAVVLTAQGEQEKSIVGVNRVVNSSRVLVIAISLAAIVVGILFGAWIYRSISLPLQKLANLSAEVAEGNLGVTLTEHSDDEIGAVEESVQTMVTNLRGTVSKIKEATSSLIICSGQLSETAALMEKSSQTQNSSIEQSSTAVTEMSQTTQDVAMNTAETSSAADGMKKMAEQGRSAMHTTVQELSRFAEMVGEAARKVGSMGEQSQAISSVIALIKDIADQTNLLALNAAIEAARAGEQGRGFAVVADEVRALAEKTTEATDDIARTVTSMLKSVGDSVDFMQEEQEAIQRVMGNVNNTLSAIDSIAGSVENVTGMVQRIAGATEEQSATSTDISRNMEDIATITRDLRSSSMNVHESSDKLSQVAQELSSQVGWFKM